MPRSEPDWGKPTVRDRRGACGVVCIMGAGLRPIGKSMESPPYPTMPTRHISIPTMYGSPSMKLGLVSRQAHERELHDGRVRKPKPHEVGVQISRRFHTEVPKTDVVCGIEAASGGGIAQAGRAEAESD